MRRALDIALPPVMAVWLWLVIAGTAPDDRSGWLHLLTIAVAVASGAALWWRRRRPVRVFAITLLLAVAAWSLSEEILFPYAALVAMFTLTRETSPVYSLPALAGVCGVTTLSLTDAKGEDVAFAVVVAVVIWALGEASRARQSAIDEAAARAVTDEQARIARELHDVIAHSVSVIVVQAAAADDVFDKRPDQARAALRSIESSAREALTELRRLLAPVRDGGAAPLTSPQPGLVRLDELAEPLRAAGLDVDIRREGEPGEPLPAGVDLSAYRIVQEALTNALRHSGAGRVEVLVRYASEAVEVTVTDNGRGDGTPETAGSGHGIVGMRERAALVGGTLEAGSDANGGGFRVHARLPLEGPPR